MTTSPVSSLVQSIGAIPPEAVIFGHSEAMLAVRERLNRLANANVPVLIQGESGTGKDIIARMIHQRSPWKTGPYVKVNCPAIPGTLLESELFGYEKGAFTGAYGMKPGRVEMAHRGTLFLDEISELDLGLQSKLLQLLQDGQFCRIGAQEDKKVEVRVVCATNRILEDEIENGTFRQDLFYRINVVNLRLPALRERRADVEELAVYFLEYYNRKFNARARALSPELIGILQKYHWPGNIRELQNIVERSVILCSGDTFSIDEAWLSIQDESATSAAPAKMTRILQDQEKEIIESALAESRGKIAGKGGAAAKLGIPPSTLDSKIKQLKIRKDRFST